jgi:hypothetical protein
MAGGTHVGQVDLALVDAARAAVLGGQIVQPGDVAYVTGSLPADQNGDNRADGWGVEATNPTNEQQFLEVYALCADDAESQ